MARQSVLGPWGLVKQGQQEILSRNKYLDLIPKVLLEHLAAPSQRGPDHSRCRLTRPAGGSRQAGPLFKRLRKVVPFTQANCPLMLLLVAHPAPPIGDVLNGRWAIRDA